MYDKHLHKSRHAPLPGRALNFLLVDDDDLCLFIHRRVLELAGCSKSTHAASNGKKAIEFLHGAADGSHPVPDVILLDLEMPIMNGISFLEAFRSLDYPGKSRIAIVLLTSSACEHHKEHALALGAVRCLPKPLTEEALTDVIRFIDEKKKVSSFVPIDTRKNHKRQIP